LFQVKKEGREKEEAKAAAVKRVKKIFDLPGQTRETPDEVPTPTDPPPPPPSIYASGLIRNSA